ncbi:lipopolysaccharide biosynthesis protein [Nocardiopsis sp. NPDC101807]|uniref:lipopolysaccharide biosynthesis protein n=1 Tax=Nocardiopsis sp. NPDC101807 TaxID=3364339 RepID=UPI0037F269AA
MTTPAREDSMDSDVPGSSGPELREYTALLRRRWRPVCAGVVGGLLLATAGVLALPSVYTSATAVQVRPTGLERFTGEQSGRLAGDVNLDTEAQVLVSDQVSAVVARTLAGTGSGPAPTTAELRERVEVSVPPNSNVLEIHYSAGSPEAARAGAEAYADAYLALRRDRVDDLIDSRLEALRAEQENRYEALAEAAGDGAVSPQATARADALRQEITDLGNGISPLSALRETVSPGAVITPAGLPESASSPVPALWLVGGAALGLVAGLLAAVARDRLDPLLRDTEETVRVGRLPVLLDLSARSSRSPSDRSPGLLGEEGGGQRVNEFAHLVRARLAVPAAGPDGVPEQAGTAVDGPGRVILVAAGTPGRAGAATAVNLAAALARTGSETLLVCADPRTDTVGELLGLPEGPGLAEALLEGEDPGGLEVRPDAVPRLRVLRHGSPGLTAPVQGTAMTELVRLLRTNADYVVVSVAAVGERADAHALAGAADLLLPVVELGRTRRADLVGLLTLAERFGVPVPGAAVLPAQPQAGPAPVAAEGPAPSEDGPAPASSEPEEADPGPGNPDTGDTGPESEVPAGAEDAEPDVVVPADTAETAAAVRFAYTAEDWEAPYTTQTWESSYTAEDWESAYTAETAETVPASPAAGAPGGSAGNPGEAGDAEGPVNAGDTGNTGDAVNAEGTGDGGPASVDTSVSGARR